MSSFKQIIFLLFLFSLNSFGQEIAVLKYNGGGDWYANPTSLPNLIRFCNQNINTKLDDKPQTVETSSVEIFQYPLVHMTGHGNVFFTPEDQENLRKYLLSGGFLHIDDNYGMDVFLRPELKKLFPEKELVELPASHPIFDYHYKFQNGIPKIHEHDNKPPQAFGIYHEDRLIVLYTYETDLGNGWENQEIHNNPEEVRQKALQMGANIVKYAFEN
tara:strand:- start:104373 stop:105020 length:648 start_codon:yes stop_codon:yes gene_type:complete